MRKNQFIENKSTIPKDIRGKHSWIDPSNRWYDNTANQLNLSCQKTHFQNYQPLKRKLDLQRTSKEENSKYKVLQKSQISNSEKTKPNITTNNIQRRRYQE